MRRPVLPAGGLPERFAQNAADNGPCPDCTRFSGLRPTNLGNFGRGPPRPDLCVRTALGPCPIRAVSHPGRAQVANEQPQ